MKWVQLLMVAIKASFAFACCLALLLLTSEPAKACDQLQLRQAYAVQQVQYVQQPVILQQVVQPQYLQRQFIAAPQYVVQQQVLKQRVYAQPVVLQQNVLKQRAQVVKSKQVIRSERSGIGRLLLGR